MAAVAVCIVAMTFPLVLLQRCLLRNAGKFVTVKGKAGRQRPLPLGGWRWVAAAIVVLWLFLTVVVPLSGITLRTFVTNWGEGVRLADVLTLANFTEVFGQPTLVRGILNTVLIGVVGGALAVGFYSRSGWRRTARTTSGRASSTTSCSCRAPCRACSPASRSCGCSCSARPHATALDDVQRLDRVHRGVARVRHAPGSSSLLQVGPELEEAARSVGASRAASAST